MVSAGAGPAGRVIVVGSVNVDLVCRVDRLPSPGETVTGGTFERHHGGKGGNQAVAAARLGAATAFIGAVGADALGAEARAALVGELVDVSELAELSDRPTGVALIVVDAKGENQIAVASGANGAIGRDAVVGALERLAPRPGDVVLVSCEIPGAAIRAALAVGRSAGAATVLNPAPATGVDRAMFGLADVVTPNRGELAAIAGAESRRIGRPYPAPDDVERQARGLLETNAEGDGVGLGVVVTLGPAGVLAVLRSDGRIEAIDVPAVSVTVVDTTGAGDALAGALAVGLAEGRSPEAAVRRAVVVAGLSTARLGARDGMPNRAELEAALGG